MEGKKLWQSIEGDELSAFVISYVICMEAHVEKRR